MYKRLTMAIVATLLIVALAVPLATLAGPQAGGSQGTQAPSKGGAKRGGERHPEIREAMRQLQHAKMTLQRDAARDFEGHRAKAVKEIDEALADLRLALQADKH